MTDIKTPKDHFILVPTDFSETANNALDYAVELAKAYDSEITLLNVISGGMKSLFFSDEQKDLLKHGIEQRLESIKQVVLEEWANGKINVVIEEGKPYKVINQIASDEKCDNVVMGVHGANGVDQLMGSTTSRVISSSPKPVIAVKESRSNPKFDKIVLPLDLSKSSKQKLAYGVQLAKQYDSTLHVIMEIEEDEFLKKRLELNLNQAIHFLNENNVRFTTKILDDNQYPEHFGKDIIQYAEEVDADLIILMTQSEVGIKEFFVGSHARQILHSSQKTPVMCISPKRTFSEAGPGEGFY